MRLKSGSEGLVQVQLSHVIPAVCNRSDMFEGGVVSIVNQTVLELMFPAVSFA